MLLKKPTVSIYVYPKDEIFIGDFRKVTDVQSLIMYQNSKLLKVIITFAYLYQKHNNGNILIDN